MIIDFWILPVALVLLWLPRQWLRFGAKVFPDPRRPRTDRDDRDVRDVSLKYREEFTKPRNGVDFLRAAAGAVAVMLCCFDSDGIAKETEVQIFVAQAAILTIAVLIQTVRREGRLALVAPVFFILGLSFGIIGWKAALFACVTIWVFNLVLPSAGVFLFVFAGLEVCFGLLLSRVPLRLAILAASLAILPVILSAVTKRRLVRLSRKTKQARA